MINLGAICRRRVPMQLKRPEIKKRKKKKMRRDLFLGFPPSPVGGGKDEFSDSGSNRLISFGSMPSYR